MEKERGNNSQAEDFLAKGRGIIDYIVAHTPTEFRESFLNLPDVQAVLASA
jgi:hypothetical protein